MPPVPESVNEWPTDQALVVTGNQQADRPEAIFRPHIHMTKMNLLLTYTSENVIVYKYA